MGGIQPEKSLISQANAEESKKIPRQEVKLENLGMRIQATEEQRKAISLGDSGIF